MPSGFELLSETVRYRADAISTIVIAIAACGICRAYLRRRGAARDFSGKTCGLVIAIPIVAALLVEGTLPFLGYPASATRSVVLMTRALVLGAAAASAAVWLITAARLALLRAELRAHADTGRQLQQATAAAD